MTSHPLNLLLLFALFSIFPACAESSGTAPDSETVTDTAALSATEAPSSPGAEPAPTETVAIEATTTTNAQQQPAQPAAKAVSAPAAAAPQKQTPRATTTESKSPQADPQPASPATPVPAEQPQAPTPPDHTAWNQLLQQYVGSNGKVNYTGLQNKKEQLDAYLDELAKAVPGSDWSRNASLAYWLNAYNAFTVKLILDNWPVKSIKDISNGNPWDVKWIELAGKKYSLNQIENDIIRPKFRDPRIHFAVNCAAVSCPPLHNRAFTAGNLDRTLEQLTRSFINNEKYNTISSETATVSKVFDWYGQDFGTLHEYLDRYAEEDVSADTEIRFKEYDWALNN